MQFHNFNVDIFLQHYWQQKPLLIKSPWTSWIPPLDANDLAGLACEEGVESRLITQADHQNGWKLEHGPFPEARFNQIDAKHWTLLVQAVDHFVPEVAALIEPFRFIPNWRIDDIMVSYATDGGGVGPHFDQYDVFLIQGSGQRRWQVGGYCDGDSELQPHEDLRLLAQFEATDEWICEPGDILYVPPGFAHNGVAMGDECMTYSIGFRAPSRSELIGYWADDLIEEMKDDDRYRDPPLEKPKNPGEISQEAIDKLHQMLLQKMDDRKAFARWFGQYNSTRKYPDMDWQADQPLGTEKLRKYLASGAALQRNPASRFSFIRQEENVVLLFVDGECFTCSDETIALAELICAEDHIHIDQNHIHSDKVMELLTKLYNQASFEFDDED
ncbi:MAG: cupin domain-containing protein [Parasphingorhabdus sp.]|uniref:cupin domain-containing protein n=1 Tax=Parasphingorhabdus sp. TaxID=2709688 RepID=UPI0030038C16